MVALNNGDLTSDEAEDAAELLFDVAALTGGYELVRCGGFRGQGDEAHERHRDPAEEGRPPVEAEVVE